MRTKIGMALAGYGAGIFFGSVSNPAIVPIGLFSLGFLLLGARLVIKGQP